MNNPNCSTPACQDRPDLAHHRKNNAMPIAYAFVVDSAPSRPNRRCRKNSSATVTTASSSSRTVQYLTPDGNLTMKARIPVPPDPYRLIDFYQPRAPHQGRHAAEPVTCPELSDVKRQAGDPGKTPVGR